MKVSLLSYSALSNGLLGCTGPHTTELENKMVCAERWYIKLLQKERSTYKHMLLCASRMYTEFFSISRTIILLELYICKVPLWSAPLQEATRSTQLVPFYILQLLSKSSDVCVWPIFPQYILHLKTSAGKLYDINAPDLQTRDDWYRSIADRIRTLADTREVHL